MAVATTVIIIWLVIIFILTRRYLRSCNLPPGPLITLPVFGNLFTVALTCYRRKLQPYELFCQWATRYGNVFSFRFGNKLVVVANDVTSVKEAFMSEDIADRPEDAVFARTTGGTGVINANGHIWRDQRKFSLGVFRRLGIGKTSFEKQVGTEVRHLVSEFKAKGNEPFSPHSFLTKAASNVICSVVLGRRFSYSDAEFNGVMHRMDRNFKILDAGGAVMFIPSLRYVPFVSKLVDEFCSNLKKNFDFVADIVATHKDEFDRDNQRDFIDACLLEIDDRKENGTRDGIEESGLTENNLRTTILNLFGAGTETTSTSISWFLLYMIAYPQVQEKVQQEIDSLVEQEGGLPELRHKTALPYTMAVTMEVMRLQAVAPLSVPHCAARDTSIQGHRVPKGSIVISNIWHMTHDPAVWDDPYELKPERFLDEEGRLNDKKIAEVPAFGIGRRVCLGENIAKMELFLFITHLMHQFTFEKPKDSPPLEFKGKGGLSNVSPPFKLVAISRGSIAD